MLGNTYQVDPKVEAQWVAVGTAFGTAVGVAIGATLAALGVLDDTTAVAVGTAVGGFVGSLASAGIRVLIGSFMPDPSETPTAP